MVTQDCCSVVVKTLFIMFLSSAEVEQRSEFLESILNPDASVINILDGATFPQLRTLYKALACVVLAIKESPQDVQHYFVDCPEHGVLYSRLCDGDTADRFLTEATFGQLQEFLISVHASLPVALSTYFEKVTE
jgi:hypothetical protein